MNHSTGVYQAITPFSPKKPPVGPSAVRVAKATGTFAPCSVVRKPLCPFRSVATYPGLTELILMRVFRSSFAKENPCLMREMFSGLTIERETFANLHMASKSVYQLYADISGVARRAGRLLMAIQPHWLASCGRFCTGWPC